MGMRWYRTAQGRLQLLQAHPPISPARVVATDSERCQHGVNPVAQRDTQQFDPERYRSVPTSDQIDETKCREIGFARRPFDLTTFEVSDGHDAGLSNSGFGTVFGIVGGRSLPSRLRRLRALRLRLPALPWRAADDPGL